MKLGSRVVLFGLTGRLTKPIDAFRNFAKASPKKGSLFRLTYHLSHVSVVSCPLTRSAEQWQEQTNDTCELKHGTYITRVLFTLNTGAKSVVYLITFYCILAYIPGGLCHSDYHVLLLLLFCRSEESFLTLTNVKFVYR